MTDDIRLEEITRELAALELRRIELINERRMLASRNRMFYCSICGERQVDAESGFDTCSYCTGRV